MCQPRKQPNSTPSKIGQTLALAAALLISATAGCNADSPGLQSSDSPEQVAGERSWNGWSMVTRPQSPTVGPNSFATVECLLRSDSGHAIPEQPVTATVTPSATEIVTRGNKVSFKANATGSYSVFCRFEDGSLADPTGSIITVEAGLPYSFVVNFPSQDCYSQNDTLPLDVEVFDFHGNLLDNTGVETNIEISVVPDVGIERDAFGALRFTEEGDYDITVRLQGPVDDRSTATPFTANIRVDTTAPRFLNVTPERGSFLQSGTLANEEILVEGLVVDGASTIQHLVINDTALTVSGSLSQESFSQTQMSRWGLSTISGTATDTCGNVGSFTQSYIRSPSYYAAATAADPAAQVQDGFTAQLNQPIYDDHDRTDIDDFATLLEALLSGFDFNSSLLPGAALVSNPARNDCTSCGWGGTWVSKGYTVRRDPNPARNITLDGPYVGALDLIDGGTSFQISLYSFELPLQVEAQSTTCALGCGSDSNITVAGRVGFSSVDIVGTLGVNYVNGRAEVAVDSFAVDVQGAFVDVDCGILDGICNSITNLVVEKAIAKLELSIMDAVAMMAPPMLEASLEELTLQSSMSLPAPLNATLNLSAGLDRLLFCGATGNLPVPTDCPAGADGFARLGIATQFYPSVRGTNIPADAPGSIRHDGVGPNFDPVNYGFGLAAKDDLLNQLFWALWYGGTFNIEDAGALAGPTTPQDPKLSIRATLPPVVMPGRNGDEFDIGLGDLYVEVEADMNTLLGVEGAAQPVTIGVYVSLILGVNIDVDPTTNELIASFNATPHIEFLSIDHPNLTYKGTLSTFVSETVAKVMPQLLGDAISGMPLPELDMSGVGGLPAGTTWKLQNADLTHTGGTLAFTGSFGQ